MQTFKHKSISDYYFLHMKDSCEYLSSNSVGYCPFPVRKTENEDFLNDWEQCPESEYLRVRDQALHFLYEMRPAVTGASKYLNETSNPLTAE